MKHNLLFRLQCFIWDQRWAKNAQPAIMWVILDKLVGQPSWAIWYRYWG